MGPFRKHSRTWDVFDQAHELSTARASRSCCVYEINGLLIRDLLIGLRAKLTVQPVQPFTITVSIQPVVTHFDKPVREYMLKIPADKFQCLQPGYLPPAGLRAPIAKAHDPFLVEGHEYSPPKSISIPHPGVNSIPQAESLVFPTFAGGESP
jgi:hypothetical protein